MKKIVLLLIIWTNIFDVQYAQSSPILITGSMVIGGGMVIGGCTDSTGATAADNTFYSSLMAGRAMNWKLGQSNPIYRAAFSLTTAGSGAATYSSSTGVFNFPTFAQYVPTVHDNTVRTLNSGFTVSATQLAFLCYSVQISVTLALSVLTGTVTLQYSTNGGTTYISLPKVAFTPLLAGLGLTTSQIVQVNGYVPANALVRIATTTISGVTYTYTDGQETY